jgi:hypothetical protein
MKGMFQREFQRTLIIHQSIFLWYDQSLETDHLCKGISNGWHGLRAVAVENARFAVHRNQPVILKSSFRCIFAEPHE